MTGGMIEPAVLAAAKDYLVPPGSETGYAVVDRQFQVDSWGNTPVDRDVRERLEPISSLRMAGGRPDALLAPPDPSAYRGDPESISKLPMAVVEAKGVSDGSSRNAPRVAITQAHNHLGEANVGFAAVPESYVTEEGRALSRELNIGLLSVTSDGVELLERPRLVGADTSSAADTIRFHARLGGTAVESFKKNHPKNALGYALALQHDGETDEVFQEYVINSVDDARLDATALRLIEREGGQLTLTSTGREAVRAIVYHHGGIEPALAAIDDLTGSSTRLIDALPVMGTVARQALLTYPPTQELVRVLETLTRSGNESPSLAEVAKAVARDRPDFALDLFVSTKSEARGRVLTDDEKEAVDLTAFDEGAIYSTHTTYQYKAMLYHAGILTERGTGTKSDLDPTSSEWALETPLV